MTSDCNVLFPFRRLATRRTTAAVGYKNEKTDSEDLIDVDMDESVLAGPKEKGRSETIKRVIARRMGRPDSTGGRHRRAVFNQMEGLVSHGANRRSWA